MTDDCKDCDGKCDSKVSASGNPNPRWDKIDVLYDKIDDSIEKAFENDKLSYMEIEIVFLMIKEKIAQQKHELYNMYISYKNGEGKEGGSKVPDKEQPDGLYR